MGPLHSLVSALETFEFIKNLKIGETDMPG